MILVLVVIWFCVFVCFEFGPCVFSFLHFGKFNPCICVLMFAARYGVVWFGMRWPLFRVCLFCGMEVV